MQLCAFGEVDIWQSIGCLPLLEFTSDIAKLFDLPSVNASYVCAGSAAVYRKHLSVPVAGCSRTCDEAMESDTAKTSIAGGILHMKRSLPTPCQ